MMKSLNVERRLRVKNTVLKKTLLSFPTFSCFNRAIPFYYVTTVLMIHQDGLENVNDNNS